MCHIILPTLFWLGCGAWLNLTNFKDCLSFILLRRIPRSVLRGCPAFAAKAAASAE